MKLVGISFLATLVFALGAVAAPAAARADEVLQPPSGPVLVTNPPVQPGAPGGPQRDPQRAAQKRAQLQALRQTLLQTFDANGDGKLGPRERMHAIKVLRRIERRLANGPGGGAGAAGPNRQGKRQRMQKFIQRYDTNGDGNVGPREMPPGAADKLRRFDRNRNGWVDPNEVE